MSKRSHETSFETSQLENKPSLDTDGYESDFKPNVSPSKSKKVKTSPQKSKKSKGEGEVSSQTPFATIEIRAELIQKQVHNQWTAKEDAIYLEIVGSHLKTSIWQAIKADGRLVYRGSPGVKAHTIAAVSGRWSVMSRG